MDYTEQFIRLNCSLMSDYKMMKLNADMKCMGLGLYLETILFLRKQQGKHSDKYIFYTLRFDCSFAAANTIKPQLL